MPAWAGRRLAAADIPLQAPGRGQNGESGTFSTPGTLVANRVQQDYFVDVVTKAILPEFNERAVPFILVFWSRDPDGSQHNHGDSLNQLEPGINGPTSRAGLRNADDDLARIQAALDRAGLTATTNIIVAADHGFSTISKGSETSGAARAACANVPRSLLPPGFLAIDLAAALRLPLFDPDNHDAVITAGVFPGRGNGLIGPDPKRPQVVVAANGGSNLVYVTGGERTLPARIVEFLGGQDYVSGIFMDDTVGSLPGTLPMSAIHLAGSAKTPRPTFVVSFRSFSTGCETPLLCAAEVADSTLQQGQGMHGSFSRADTMNFGRLRTSPDPVDNYVVSPVWKNTISKCIVSAPIGNLDGVARAGDGTPHVYGWSLDPNSPGAPLQVHLYFDGPYPYGRGYATVARLARPDVNSGTGYGGAHGFDFPVPPELLDGHPHTVYAYGIGLAGGNNRLLSTVPATFDAIHADSRAPRNVMIASAKAPDQCLDVVGASRSQGTELQTFACNGGVNQQFVFRADTGEITALGEPTICLDAASGAGRNGDRVIVWPCNGDANQRWSYNPENGEIRGINGKCVDGSNSSVDDGAAVQIWTCNGGQHQSWFLKGGTTAGVAPTGPGTLPHGDGWEELDHNAVTTQIVVDERSAQLYQRHRDGRIWRYTGAPMTGWQELDNNPATVSLVAGDGELYQLHRDERIWRYTGVPFTGWQELDDNPATVAIAAGAGQLYQLHSSGRIWRYTGTPHSGWQELGSNPATRAIAVDDTTGELFQLHVTGRIWRYTGQPITGWQEVDNNPATCRIAANGGNLYQQHEGGAIWKFTGTPFTGWQLLDTNPASVGIVATGSRLYQLHSTGAIWRYTGTPITGWAQLDGNPLTTAIAAGLGQLFQLHSTGAIWHFTER